MYTISYGILFVDFDEWIRSVCDVERCCKRNNDVKKNPIRGKHTLWKLNQWRNKSIDDTKFQTQQQQFIGYEFEAAE